MIEFSYPLSDHRNKHRCVDCKWARDMGEKTIQFKPKDPSSGAMHHQYRCGHPDAAFARSQTEAGQVSNCEKWEARG
jgi:hypothetical protein